MNYINYMDHGLIVIGLVVFAAAGLGVCLLFQAFLGWVLFPTNEGLPIHHRPGLGEKNIGYRCKDCGCTDVLFDGMAGWDRYKQGFYLKGVNPERDPPTCVSCESFNCEQVEVSKDGCFPELSPAPTGS